MLLHGGEPRRWSSRRQLVRGFRNLCRVLGAVALFMPPSEGQEPRALTVSAQAIEGRKCAETAKVHPDLRIVYNLTYGVLAGEAGRFSLVGDYTTTIQRPTVLGWAFLFAGSAHCAGFRAILRVPTVSGMGGMTRPVRPCSALSSLETYANFFAGAHAGGLSWPWLTRASLPSVVHHAWMCGTSMRVCWSASAINIASRKSIGARRSSSAPTAPSPRSLFSSPR